MESINQIKDFFQNITLENIIDISIGLAIIIFFKIFSSSFAYIIIKMFKFKIKNKKQIKENGFYKPLKIFFVVFGIYIAFLILKLPENISYIITKIFKMCTITLTAKGFANLFNSNSESFANFRQKIHFNGNDATISFFSKVIKSLIYLVTGFILITELGYNLGGLATGLGISSVVIALAAQDIAKSFLAGISIISDKPFEIGDYITIDNFSGTVEDITFRTTRIRDVDNQIIILPNSLLASANIINASKREKRRYNLVLTLELDTSLEKVSSLKETINNKLVSHSNVLKDGIRVFFDTISSDGINLSITCYTDFVDLMDFMRFKEELNYTILEIVNNAQISLAYPSQSIYLKKE